MTIYMVYNSLPHEFDMYAIHGFFLTKEEAEDCIEDLNKEYPKTSFKYRDFEVGERIY